MTIAITGATGHLGRLVIAKLKAKVPADTIVALARTPSKGADLGVAVREADYDRPDTLAPALRGIDKLLLISANEVGKRATQHRAVIAAAKAAGVKSVAYTSILHADRSAIELAVEHLATETELAKSGLPTTLLRNGWYTENYMGAVPGALGSGVWLGAAGDGKVSGAARADYAEAAVAVLVGTGHEGRTYELAGDTAFTLAELAAEVGRQAGRSVTYKNLPAADYAATLAKFGLPEDVARMIAGWDVATAQGALFDDSHQLSKLIGRPTTPLSKVVADALAT